MESILELLKSYFALALVLVIFSYLMPKEGYKKYMQFFVGILLGVIILRPVAEWIVTDDTPMENLEELTEQLEAISFDMEGEDMYEIYFEISGKMEGSQVE